MRKYIALLFCGLICSATPAKLSWSKLELLEGKLEKWSQNVGEKDLIKIGKMNQRPEEIKYIRAFFPYLLPQGFFSRKLDLSCYPSFDQFKKERNSKTYHSWKSCINELYADNPPELLQRAINDLRPASK
ncbi:MAG: hypothetical protein K9K67_08530 [Bacteriovoracaceae bacterium]|nr:hypothetical protein [Bacteriovoracaceae bacterium]